MVGDNPYFNAGFGLLILGSGLGLLRQGGKVLWDFVDKKYFISLEVSSRDRSYGWVLSWLPTLHQANAGRNRIANRFSRLLTSYSNNHLSVETFFQQRNNGTSWSAFNLIPSPGSHFYCWKGKLIQVTRVRDKGASPLSSGGGLIQQPFESITLRTFARDSSLFIELLKEARDMATALEEGKLVIYKAFGSEWRETGQLQNKRRLASVVLEHGLAESILSDIKSFLQSREWYVNRGVPYRRGYLLCGPPGTGKSSFIKALAGHLDYCICLMNLGESHLTDDRLQHLLSTLPERSFLLLEDIDAAFSSARTGSTKTSMLTFSGLLNALDGVASAEEVVVFMTTNHPERLDPALMRPGRIDVIKKFNLTTAEQAAALFKNFYPETSQTNMPLLFSKTLFDEYPNGVSPAFIQNHFICNKDNPNSAISSLMEKQ